MHGFLDHHPHSVNHAAAQRFGLAALLGFGALNAFGGGYFALSGAPGVPRQWLSGTPFADYFVPGLVLLVVVGGAFLAAAIAVARASPLARPTAIAAGGIVLGWLLVELLMIGYVSWMQPVTAAAGVLLLVLAWFLPSPPRGHQAGHQL